VDGETATKAGRTLQGGEEIEVIVPAAVEGELQPEAIPLDIVFENADVIVVNKEAGMVVHPAVGHATGTLVAAVLAHAPDIEGVGGELRPGLVHRLDKDTSGLILLAKNERAQRQLQAQFEARTVEKTYLALVDGHPPTPTGRVEAAIGRDPKDRKKMAALPESKGRAATSEYRTMERFPQHTLLEVDLHTGRTHQIRVHAAFAGHPIAGDVKYGAREFNSRMREFGLQRMFLHATAVTFRWPDSREKMAISVELPADLAALLQRLPRRAAGQD
jgi:23S rRNA pseudouridine1911/1915/1917 synthase